MSKVPKIMKPWLCKVEAACQMLMLGGMMLGVLIGLLPVWTVVVLLLIVGMYIGYRYVGGGSNG